jgi:hypothetical protein
LSGRTIGVSCHLTPEATHADTHRFLLLRPTLGDHFSRPGSGFHLSLPRAFAEPAFPGPTISVYEERSHSWVQMPKDIEHMA